jgi:hypothetical protein
VVHIFKLANLPTIFLNFIFYLYLAVDKHSDGSFALKTLKQKLFVDGLCYLIQEIYGVERKSNEEVIDEEIDDTGNFDIFVKNFVKILGRVLLI